MAFSPYLQQRRKPIPAVGQGPIGDPMSTGLAVPGGAPAGDPNSTGLAIPGGPAVPPANRTIPRFDQPAPTQYTPGVPRTTRTKRDMIPDPVAGPSLGPTGTPPGAPPLPTGVGRAPQMPPSPTPPLSTPTTTMAPKPAGVITEGSGFNPARPPATAPSGGPPLAQPNVPGTRVTPYGPEGDLRGGMITPEMTARGTAAQGMADTAAQNVAGYDLTGSANRLAGDYRSQLQTPDLQFRGVNTNVTGQDINPNIDFQGIDTAVAGGPTITPQDTADLARFRQMQGSAAEDLSGGMSRSQIAQQRLQAFDTAAQPQIRDQIRAVGQRAAQLGRLGMGDTSVEALKPYTDYLTQRAAMEGNLAATTAEGEIADRANRLAQLQGLVGQEENIGASRRGELRGERDYSTGLQERNVARAVGERDTGLGVAAGNVSRQMQNRDFSTGLAERNVGRATNERDTQAALDATNRQYNAQTRQAALEAAMGMAGQQNAANLNRFGALSGYAGDIANQEAGQRNEVRGERDFQQMMAQQAFQNAMAQRQQANSEYGQDANIAMQQAALGYGFDPTGAYQNAAGQAGQQAGQGWQGATDALTWWLANQRRQQQGG